MQNKLEKFLKVFVSRNFFLYILFGGIATIVDWGVFALGVYYFNIHYITSVSFAFILGSITNFSLNKYFNFRNKYKKLHYQFILYLIVALIGLGLTILLMWTFIDYFKFEKFVSRIITTAIILIYNFLGHKFFTFRLLK